MKHLRWNISAGAILLFALMYFYDSEGLVAAAVPAICVHELGHLIPLRLFGHPLRRISVGVFGMEIDYRGQLAGIQALACIGGGPLAGLIFAVSACAFGGSFWRMSGSVSFLLSVFNLLPVLPLDGGRLLTAITDASFAQKLSRIAALLIFLGGAVIALRFQSFSLLLMGAWLTICNYRPGADL